MAFKIGQGWSWVNFSGFFQVKLHLVGESVPLLPKNGSGSWWPSLNKKFWVDDVLIVNHWHGTIWETWVHHVSKFYTPPIPIPLKLLHFNSKQMDFVRCHSHIVKWIGGLSYSKAAEYGSTPPPPRQEVIIYLEYKCLLKWGFCWNVPLGWWLYTSRQLVRPTKMDWPRWWHSLDSAMGSIRCPSY